MATPGPGRWTVQMGSPSGEASSEVTGSEIAALWIWPLALLLAEKGRPYLLRPWDYYSQPPRPWDEAMDKMTSAHSQEQRTGSIFLF